MNRILWDINELYDGKNDGKKNDGEKEDFLRKMGHEKVLESQYFLTLPIKDKRAQHILGVLQCEKENTLRAGIINHSIGTAQYLGTYSMKLYFRYDIEKLGICGAIPLSVILGHPRPKVLQRILRDLTAIGVCAIYVSHSTLGEKSYFSSHIWKNTKNLLQDGAMQGGGNAIPQLFMMSSFQECCRHVSHVEEKILLHIEDEHNTTHDRNVKYVHEIGGHASACIVVGAERGLTDKESAYFITQGFHPYTMGPHILRTETVVSTVTSLWASQYWQHTETHTHND